MCIAVPVQVVKIDDLNSEALVDMGGARWKINIELVSGVEKGDYVLLHAGCAIQKINRKEAVDTLTLMRKLSGNSLK